MIQSIRHFFARHFLRRAGEANQPAIPTGQRVYAVGDIHGRLDLFEALIEAIEQDDGSTMSAQTTVILLGDLVDRGPDSAGVIARARQWQKQRSVRILWGNHEEMFLASLRKSETLRHFLRFGGRETLQSYGINIQTEEPTELDILRAQMQESIPEEDIRFIHNFENLIVIGDYAFVHAGIAPERPLKQQTPADLRWIREPFLSFSRPHSHVIVHGHTIYETSDIQSNRIGIDTGAFSSGRLTALVLEGTGRRFIETEVTGGVVNTLMRKADA